MGDQEKERLIHRQFLFSLSFFSGGGCGILVTKAGPVSISTSWKSYILWFILLFIFYLVFRNSSFLLLNGYSIYGLCLTFWTNEFLGSYSNYKFIISFSIFNRM